MIPQGGFPRWIVLGSTQAATAVLGSWRPFKLSTRLRWSAVVGAAALDLLSHLPGVVRGAAEVDPAYWAQRLPAFSEDWALVIHVGNQSHTRKVIVFFVAPGGAIQAVAKVPLVPGAPAAILNEAEVLRHLRPSLGAPHTLFQDSSSGIAAQSWLEGKPVSRELTARHVAFVAGLALQNKTVRVSEFRGEIAAALDRADLPFDRSVLDKALVLLELDAPLPAFVEHRDFAPWNLKRLADGRTAALDWEWAVLTGLPCQDLFRFFFIQDALFHGPGKVWDTLLKNRLLQEHYRQFSIPRQALGALVLHYLLRVLCVDWGSGNVPLAEFSFRQICGVLDRLKEPRAFMLKG